MQQDPDLSALMVGSQAAINAPTRRCCGPACLAAAAIRRQGVPGDRVDDVVQDVLLTIHRARATYDPSRPFLPWLRAIASAAPSMRCAHIVAARRARCPTTTRISPIPTAARAADAGLDRADRARCWRGDRHIVAGPARGRGVAGIARAVAGGGGGADRAQQGRAESEFAPGHPGAAAAMAEARDA